MRFLRHAAVLATAAVSAVSAIELDVTSAASIKSAASTIAGKMVAFYPGDQPGGIPGLLGDPYYWWEAGAMFGSLIDYWYYTGDDQYNNITTQALLFQLSPTYNYMPPNESKSEGNDDQVFWGFSAMTAAEYKYPNPPDSYPSWISIAAAVFNSQAARWDTTLCGGGLRWQIYSFNNGYNYKNSPSNGGFINLGARLFAYTGNSTYQDWVEKTWDWMSEIGLYGSAGQVYDGSDGLLNCTQLDHIQWTYSAGMMLNAAAVMYNATGNTMWQDRMNLIWNASSIFFDNKVMFEEACETGKNCDTDQLSFKAYFSRFLAASIKWDASLYDQVQPYFAASAQAAAAQCSGGSDGITCGTQWTNNGTWDGTYGVGQQMSALEVVQANLIQQVTAPVTNDTGISHGNLTLGSGTQTNTEVVYKPITTADKAGAYILTFLMCAASVGVA